MKFVCLGDRNAPTKPVMADHPFLAMGKSDAQRLCELRESECVKGIVFLLDFEELLS
jgi:hypothetical protein